MTAKRIPHSHCRPVYLDCDLDLSPIKRKVSLESLPNELLAEIFSYLIPEERTVNTKIPKDLEISRRIGCQHDCNQQNTHSPGPNSNPLNIMATSSLFYHIGRQHPTFKHRSYFVRISPIAIDFEGHTDRSLERLQATMPLLQNLRLVLDVGDWGVNMRDGHVNRFLSNYELFFRRFGGPRITMRTGKLQLRLQGNFACEEDEEVEVPDCLQELGNRCAEALISGQEEELEGVMQWRDDEWVDGGEGESHPERGMAELGRRLRNGQIADLLRLLAGFLYNE